MSSNVMMPRDDWVALLDSIREKGGTTDLMTVSQAKDAVDAIETGGGEYSADDIATGITGTLTITVDSISRARAFSCQTFSQINGPFLRTGATSTAVTDVFSDCKNLTSVNFPLLRNVSGANFLAKCTSLTYIAFPSLEGMAGGFMQGCTSLEAVDFRVLKKMSTDNAFLNCSALHTIILRTNECIPINAPTYWAFCLKGTPFASGGTGGEIYIPELLYSHLGDGSSLDYKAATNWAAIDSFGTITWKVIEGSIYETQYADGTPIE